MRVHRTVLAAVLAVLGMTLTPMAAQADSPWIEYREADFSVPAGVACTFQVDLRMVKDHEAYRNIAFYDDGTVKTQLWKGLLVIEFINHDTGASITKNVNGRAHIDYAPDGAFTSITLLSGHFTAIVPPGNELDPGVYFVGGRGTTMTVGSQPSIRTIEYGRTGSAVNLCEAIAA